VLLGDREHVAHATAGTDPHGPRLHVEVDVGEVRAVDYDAVVDDGAPGDVVAAAADGDLSVVLVGEADGRCDVVGRGDGDDGNRSMRPFQSARASWYVSSPGTMTSPSTAARRSETSDSSRW
jgi:hypothetical protein